MMENEKKTDKSQDQNLKSCWSNFTSEATLHGVGKLSGSKVRIICWTLIIVVSFAYLTYNLTMELQNYYSYPVKTQVKVEFHDEMVFPAVTICNLCWRNKSLQDNSPQAQTFYRALSANPKMFPKINWSDPFYKDNGYFDPWTAEEYFSDAMNMAEVLRICWFDNTQIAKCETAFTVLQNTEGVCYTFNLQGSVKTKFSGSEYNLRIFVDINSDYYTWGNEDAAGIKIIVHEPNTRPNVDTRGFRVFPGTAAYVEVVKKKYVYQRRPYQAFTNKYCVPDLPDTKQHTGTSYRYTHDSCEGICKRGLVKKICKCEMLLNLGQFSGCSKYDYETCYKPTLANVSANSSLMSTCDCQHSCETSDYFTSVTYAKFPSDFVLQSLNGTALTRVDRIRTDAILLHVYYKHLATEALIQEPVYAGICDVMSNIGGQMGLFLGASIMSFLELGELLGMFMLVLWKRQKQKRKITEPSTNGENMNYEEKNPELFFH